MGKIFNSKLVSVEKASSTKAVFLTITKFCCESILQLLLLIVVLNSSEIHRLVKGTIHIGQTFFKSSVSHGKFPAHQTFTRINH